MRFSRFSGATAFILAASIAGCDRPHPSPTGPGSAAEPSSVAQPAKPENMVTVGTPATPNDFSRVAKHLDLGGNFFIYWSIDQIVAQASSAADDFKASIQAEAESQSKQPEFEQLWAALSKLMRASGALTIESISASAFELEPKLFRTKSLVSKKPASSGFLWEFPGRPPHEIDFLKMLPKETALVETLDYDLKRIWTAIQNVAADVPEAGAELAEVPAQFEAATGMKWETFLNESGGEVVLALTLDPTKKLTFPVPEAGNIEVMEPGLILAFRVKGTGIFDRVDTLLKDVPHTVADRDGAKIRVGPAGEYEGLRYGPSIAQAGEWLILTSREDLLLQLLDVAAGKTPGLLQSEEYKRLQKHVPTKANGLAYLGRNLSQALQSIQTTALHSQEVGKLTDSFKKRILQFMELPEKLVTVEFNDDGILVTEVGGAAMPSSSLAAPAAFLLPIAAAGVIPYYMRKSSEESQSTQVLNEARMLDAAADQWAIENNIATGTPIELDAILLYLKPNSRIVQSKGIDPLGNPYILGKIGDQPSQVLIAPETKEFFSNEVPPDFWQSF